VLRIVNAYVIERLLATKRRDAMAEQELNVSELEAPEPLERILDALADIAEEDWLKVIHRMNPVPMYSIVKGMGYLCHTKQVAPRRFEILIWPETAQRPPGC